MSQIYIKPFILSYWAQKSVSELMRQKYCTQLSKTIDICLEEAARTFKPEQKNRAIQFLQLKNLSKIDAIQQNAHSDKRFL